MSDAAMVLGTADRLMADQCDDATVRRAAWSAGSPPVRLGCFGS